MARRQRRGLSTIVGALLFLVILVSAFGSLITAMSFMTSFQQKSIAVSSQNVDQLSEEFGTRIRIGTDCVLALEVLNDGPIAIEITELFLVNTTDNEIKRYDVSNSVVSSEARVNVTESSLLSLDGVSPQTITLAANKEYVVKVVTDLGTMKEEAFATGDSCGTTPLVGNLIAIPPEIASGDKVTVAFIVVNTADVDMRNVTLANSPSYNLTVSPPSALDSQTLVTPSKEPNLTAGGSVVFMWDIFLKGAIGQEITLSTSATNSFGDSTGTEEAKVKITREYTRQTVSARLVAKPEVFMLVPGPFGDSSGKGIFGLAVVNPTNVTFTVSKVVFVLATTSSESSSQMVGTGCADDGIIPDQDANWSCPNEGLIQWQNTASPISVSPQRVQPFIVKVTPGNAGAGGADIAAFVVSVTVHSSFGQISKGDYSPSMDGSAGPIANVYLTDTNDDTLVDDANESVIIGDVIFDVNPVTMRKVNVTLADLDTASGAYIESGGKLIINVPAGFTVGAVTSSAKFSSATLTIFEDDSSQIIATLGQHLGDQASAEAAAVMFEVTPPAVLEDRVFIMYCLADGPTTGGLALGAVAEIPLVTDF